jgi:hypothetical protein
VEKNESCTKLTSSGEIAELEALLEAKKEQKREMEMKYEPIVDYVVQEVQRKNLP